MKLPAFPTVLPPWTRGLAVFLAVLSQTATSQALTIISYGYGADYLQTDAATVGLDTGLSGGAFRFAFTLSDDAGADPLTDPPPTVRGFFINTNGQMEAGPIHTLPFFEFGPPVVSGLGGSTAGLRYASQAAMEAAWPNSATHYQITHRLFGADESFSVSGSHLALPTSVAQFNLSGGVWNSGVYHLAQDQTLGVTTSSFAHFTAGSSLGGDVISLRLTHDASPASPVQTWSRTYLHNISPANFFAESLAAFSLNAGDTYTLSATFRHANDNDGVLGNDGVFSENTTSVRIAVTAASVPDATPTAALIGLALATGLRRRRGCRASA